MRPGRSQLGAGELREGLGTEVLEAGDNQLPLLAGDIAGAVQVMGGRGGRVPTLHDKADDDYNDDDDDDDRGEDDDDPGGERSAG